MDTRAEKKIKNIAEKKDVKPSEKNINDCDKVNVISLLVALIAISTIGFIYLDECKKCFNHCQHTITQNYEESSTNFGKAFKVFGKNVESGYLRHVFHVLDRIGYQNNPNNTDWDLLWAHDYPFRVLYQELKALKPHQKVNHFPGCGYLTNKVDLATSNLKYIPSAFKLPEHKDKLLEYSSQNPTKKFVVKNNEHRHVHVKDISEISLEDNNTFVQEFIDNPLLVSGHMFDIGVYTVITSIDSLRIYIYHGDVLLRFCPEQYYPFDSNNLDKYVVGDDYLPIWEVPGLTKYYEDLGFGMRESLSAYLAAKGQDSSKIWSQIEDAINISILAKQKSIINIVKRFKSKRNFFEMMRFDFIVDEDLNVHLMEANMSPNLSSAHFKPNQLLYEQVIFNLFGLVGVAPRLQSESLIIRSKEEQLMQSADKNVAVMHQLCASNQCKDCELFECQLCKSCWTSQLKQDLLDAHNEHLNRGDCKRIFPPTMVQNGKLPDNFADYAPNNQLMYLWFQEKCNIDQTWCT